jgi:hypothetical protein
MPTTNPIENDTNPHDSHINRRSFLKGCLGLFGAGAATLGAAAGYPILVEPFLIQKNHYTLPVPNLPHAFEGFRIVHLTDIHHGPLVPASFVRRMIRMANDQAPDLIACTGDYVHHTDTTKEIDAVWPLLADLNAAEGVYAVLGNHDHWADFERSRHWMKENGQDLYKKAIRLERNGASLWFGGAGDEWEDTPDIDAAFKNAPSSDCKVCLAHNPDTVDGSHRTRIDLFLCGHTHGGQIWLPLANKPISSRQLPVRNKAYISGFIQNGAKSLFISRGLGWGVLPVRFNCPPEIAILTLTGRKDP